MVEGLSRRGPLADKHISIRGCVCDAKGDAVDDAAGDAGACIAVTSPMTSMEMYRWRRMRIHAITMCFRGANGNKLEAMNTNERRE
jgi:hypothetical protein